MRRSRFAWMSAAVALAVLGCERERLSPDEHAARTAVARYNEALVQAYRTGNADLLREVAGPQEQDRVSSIIQSLARNGLYMEARQTDYGVVRVTVNPRANGVTLVDTLESWGYEHRALADRDRPAPQKKARYRLAYELVRKDGRFAVHRVVEHELPPGERAP